MTPVSSPPSMALSRAACVFDGARAQRLWRGLFLLLVATVMTLALLPAGPRLPSLGWDKLNHTAAFAALAFAARFAFPGMRALHPRLGAALLALGALIEVAQALTPDRMADAADLLADGLGIAAGFALAALVWRGLRPACRT